MSVEQRRARLVARHGLHGAGTRAAQVTASVLALHATDPASVYLSVLARCPGLTREDVARELYDDGSLVRLMAMRRTVFVVTRELLPVVHHGVSTGVAATLRKTLLSQLTRLPTDPPLPEGQTELAAWLDELIAQVARTAAEIGPVNGSALADAVPGLRTALLPTTDKVYDVRRSITSQVLTLMGAEGRLVRGRPGGGWTSRQHVWQAGDQVWSEGIEQLSTADAQSGLAAAYLRRFGPATETDVTWWTGWSKTATRAALRALDLVEVDGLLLLADDQDEVPLSPPAATLLPALDPTPMGWKQREWFLPADSAPLYDRFGNIGPTVWWGGEVVGGWAVDTSGTVVTASLADRGRTAEVAIGDEAERLTARLAGDTVVPSFPTPLEKQLRTG